MAAPAWQPGAPVPPMYQHPGAPVGPPRPRGRGKLVAGALALALIAGGAGGIAGWFIGSGDGATTTVQSVSMDAGEGMTYTEIVNKVSPSVVTIVTDAAEGSGVVYSKDGYIVTNNHVVDGAQSVEVRFSDGTTSRRDHRRHRRHPGPRRHPSQRRGRPDTGHLRRLRAPCRSATSPSRSAPRSASKAP